jgi:hypothetical protein
MNYEAETMKDKDGRVKKAIPVDKSLEAMNNNQLSIDSHKTE